MKRSALVFLLGAACASRDGAPGREPSSVPSSATTARATTATDTAARCAGCHPVIADEWRSSFHRTAFSDATFQRSLALEEASAKAFCVHCHAPEADPRANAGRPPDDRALAIGVGCTSCHGDADAPRTAHAPPLAPARVAPHRVTVDPAFATEKACAACHQFTFDDGRPDLVQRTLDEHAASPFAGVSCATCHMPRRDGHRDHRFLAGHDPARIAEAVRIEAHLRRGPARSDRPVVVTIHVETSAGHAFPTGDMFRRARLLVFGEDEGGGIVASEERRFGRTWGRAEPSGLRRELSDTRIRGNFEAEIPLLEAAAAPGRASSIARVRYVLLFERVLSMRGDDDVTLVSSDVVAEGYAVPTTAQTAQAVQAVQKDTSKSIGP